MTNPEFATIRFRPVKAADIRQYVNWRYEPPYDIYNEDPSMEDEITAYYLDPLFNARAMVGPDGRLMGICSFGPDGRVRGGRYEVEALDIGLAIRPDLTGQGRGRHYIEAVVAFAWENFHPPALRVTIAAFNKRAQRVWQQAGFRIVEQFGRRVDNFPFNVYKLEKNRERGMTNT